MHASKWNGSMYWCCGKAKEESNGCIRSRHECRDDEDEENETGEDIDKLNNSKKRCSSCREIGHFPHQCPKDPNARTNATQRDELDRIYFSKRRRERLGNSNSQMSLKIKTLLLYKDKDLLQVATNKLDFEDIDEFRLTALKSPRPDVYEISKKTIDKSISPRNKAQRRSFPAGLDFNFESEFLGSPKNGEKQFGFKLHPITSEGI